MMIRPLAALGCAFFMATGFHVYSIKAEVDAVGAELRRTLHATEAERVRARTLSAEWARLNDQDRLQRLATTHLQELQPTTPQQFVRVADAARRLPAPTPFAGGPSAFRARADGPVVPGEVLVFSARTMLAEASARPRMSDAGREAAPAPLAAVATAVQAPAASAAQAPAASTAQAPAAPTAQAPAASAARAPAASAPPASPPPALAPPALASASPAEPPPRETRAAAPAPRAPEPRPAPPRMAEARPMPPPRPAADPSLRTALHVRPQEAPQGRPVSAPLAPPMAFGGSVLGGGGALPPPMPFGR